MKSETTVAERPVLVSEREGVIELVLNRPDKLNALDEQTLDIIRDAVEDLRLRDELRVMLIRAKGRYFSAGADLTAFQEMPDRMSGLKSRSWFRREMGGMHPLAGDGACRKADRGGSSRHVRRRGARNVAVVRFPSCRGQRRLLVPRNEAGDGSGIGWG